MRNSGWKGEREVADNILAVSEAQSSFLHAISNDMTMSATHQLVPKLAFSYPMRRCDAVRAERGLPFRGQLVHARSYTDSSRNSFAAPELTGGRVGEGCQDRACDAAGSRRERPATKLLRRYRYRSRALNVSRL